MNSLYIQALKSKNRKKLFWTWFIPAVLVFTPFAVKIFYWLGFMVGPAVALYCIKEKFFAMMISDEEAERIVESHNSFQNRRNRYD